MKGESTTIRKARRGYRCDTTDRVPPCVGRIDPGERYTRVTRIRTSR